MSAPDEGAAQPASRRVFYNRVSALLTIFVGVLLWAWRDVRTRRARNGWDRTLAVSVALVQLEPVDDTAIAALRSKLAALEERMTAEMIRHRPGGLHPFWFELAGPVDGTAPPPAPIDDGPVALTSYSLALSS